MFGVSRWSTGGSPRSGSSGRYASSTPSTARGRVIALHTEAERRARFVGRRRGGAAARERARNAVPGPRRAGRALRRAGPTRPGSAGASSPRTRRSPSCAPSWGSSSSDRRRRRCACSATRSRPSCWPSRPACRWRRGAAARSTTSTPPGGTGTVGYPLIVKARSGGGGRGIRVVTDRGGARRAFLREQQEAQRTFDDPVVFLERLVRGGRHIEVQVIADAHGTVWAPGVRDCSVQRRNQKVIEESSSPALTREQDACLRVGRGAGGRRRLRRRRHGGVPVPAQRGAVHLPGGEHPAAGRAPGDRGHHRPRHRQAAAHVAAGEPLLEATRRPSAGTPSRPASTPRTPSTTSPRPPARSSCCRLPSGPGVRVDTGLAVGEVIPPLYDSMVAKVIAWGQRPGGGTGPAAVRAARDDGRPAGWHHHEVLPARAAGPPRGRRGHRRHGLAGPGRWRCASRGGPADAGGGAAAGRRGRVRRAGGARARRVPGLGPRRTAARRPRRRPDRRARRRGQVYRLSGSTQTGGARYRVELDGRSVEAQVDRLGPLQSRLTVGAARHAVVAVHGATSHLVEVDGVTHRVTRDEAGVLRAPAPAVVVGLRPRSGRRSRPAQTVGVVESMKMETPLRAPFTGRVREISVAVNSQVDAGAALLRVDSGGDGERRGRGAGRAPGAGGRGRHRPGPRRWTCSTACARCSPATTWTRPGPARWSGDWTAPRADLPVDDPSCCTPSWPSSRPSPNLRAVPQPADDRRGGHRRAGAQPA